MKEGILNQTCLRSSYSLRRQMIVSYGSTAVFTIGLVIVIAALAANHAGKTVYDETRDLLLERILSGISNHEIVIGKIVSQKFQTIKGSSALLSEIIRDRIVGYPDQFEDDRHVPFRDMDTEQNRYPLNAATLPLDFEFQPNLTPDTLREQTQEREKLFGEYADFFTTASSTFFFQGNCDPNQDDETGPGYLKNCTAANNDPRTGGVIHPVGTLSGLADKSNDIGIFLKPLFEAEPSVMQFSVYFFNSGAGATLTFPGARAETRRSYKSDGCEWMREENPYTGEPYGSDEEIGRCAPKGTIVPSRLFNPMEREFCRDQALFPKEIRIYGPFFDEFWGEWRISLGQAVFDRRTGKFIACTSQDIALQLIDEWVESLLVDSRIHPVITLMDGSIVAGAETDFQDIDAAMSVVDSGILDQSMFTRLTANRFWEKVWDATAVKKEVTNNIRTIDDKIIAEVPVPLPPETYDENYKPDFYLFVTTNLSGAAKVVNDIDRAIDDGVSVLVKNIILIGLGGIIVSLFVVTFASHILTRQLAWIEAATWKIVNHADRRVSDGPVVSNAQDEANEPNVLFAPKTEVSELVAEFQVMIRGFSGTGASRVAPQKRDEIKNFVTWKEEFRQFYELNESMENRIREEMSQKAQSYGRRINVGKRSRNSSSYGPTASEIIANMSEASQVSEEDSTFRSSAVGQSYSQQKQFGRTDSSTMFKRPLTRTNLGSVVPVQGAFAPTTNSEDRLRIWKSSLFRWVLCAIVLPLMLTNAVIAAIVATQFLAFLNDIERADVFAIELGKDFLKISAGLYAHYGGQAMAASIRDLHMLTRISSWLLFGAVRRSEAFAEVDMSLGEECKAYVGTEVKCPFVLDDTRSPCDCEWKDPWDQTCRDFDSPSRSFQRMWFVGQAADFDPENGDRLSTSFPESDSGHNPVSTKWWTDADDMPGAERGSNASGYETSYDRLRVSSAVQAIVLPLYNYPSLEGYDGPRISASSYLAFEADGGYLGYAGCNYDVSDFAGRFQSSDENEAYKVRPELCPRGKYGYDPRCRQWYDDTKWDIQNGYLHMTAPYRSRTSNTLGTTTACSALVDPESGEFVGAVAIDLTPRELFWNLESNEADVFFIISTAVGNDTVFFGPRYQWNGGPENIADVALPNDAANSSNREKFTEITDRMKKGEVGIAEFYNTSQTRTNDSILVSFAPLRSRALKVVRPNDFSAGVEQSEIVIYSLGMAQSMKTLVVRFEGIDEQINENLGKTTTVFISGVALITLICIMITAKISATIVKSLLILLKIVKRVNAGRIEDDMPPLEGGSREVTQVHTSFAKLYRVVRMANASFFSGDFKWAHHIANDALSLFRKIGDQKAVAVACNNIGNTILALSVQRNDKTLTLRPGSCCQTESALLYFDEAIEIGTKEFEAAESDEKKAEFAQQLADRHFNRAMCLLYFDGGPCCIAEAKEKAFLDLFKCKEYDRGIQEYMLHSKSMFKFSDIVFERLMRRLHGLSFMFGIDQKAWQIWDVNDLVEQADLMLQAAWDQEHAPLFRDVKRVGRLQQLEAAVIILELVSGKLQEAAQLSMRMFVEDEFILHSSFVVAADAILRLMKEPMLTWSREARLRTSLEFRRMRRAGKKAALDIERCFVFCIELGEKLEGGFELSKINAEVMAFYDAQCNDEDTVGVVAMNNTSVSNLIVKLGTKEKIDKDQREALETATTTISGTMSHPALQTAIDMVVSPSRSRTSDVFLIYVSDGSIWDARSFSGMIKRVSEASSKRTAAISVISIGINVEDDAFAQNCRDLCLATRSRNSSYLVATGENINGVFEQAAELVSSSSSSESSRMQYGITMERF